MLLRNTLIFLSLTTLIYLSLDGRNISDTIKTSMIIHSGDAPSIISEIREKGTLSDEDEYNSLLIRAREWEYAYVLDILERRFRWDTLLLRTPWYELYGDTLALSGYSREKEVRDTFYTKAIWLYEKAESLETSERRKEKITLLQNELHQEWGQSSSTSGSNTSASGGSNTIKTELSQSDRIRINEAKIKLQDFKENPVPYVRFPGDKRSGDTTLEELWNSLQWEGQSGKEDW